MQNSGIGKDSFVSRLLDDVSAYDVTGAGERDPESFIKQVAMSVYIGTEFYRSN